MDASAREKAGIVSSSTGSETKSSLDSLMETVGQGVEGALESLSQMLESIKTFAPELSSILQAFLGGSKSGDSSQNNIERANPSEQASGAHSGPQNFNNHEEQRNLEGSANSEPVEKDKNISLSPEDHPVQINARSGNRVMKYAPTQEAWKIIQGLKPDEPLVEVANYQKYNKRIESKESVKKALDLANEYAKRDGFQISIFSGWRSPYKQKEIKDADIAKGRKTSKWVAPAGRSWHGSGGAVDVFLHQMHSEQRLTPVGSESISKYEKQYMDRLEMYMNMAGFVRYDAEPWHFELGSKGAAEITQKQGYIDSNVPLDQITYIRDKLGEPSHHEHA